jgi:hypothetical protein
MGRSKQKNDRVHVDTVLSREGSGDSYAYETLHILMDGKVTVLDEPFP